jgi:3-oxoacyl-[acyl-carrier protein] reductase
MKELENSHVFLTGGSRGLGLEICRTLLQSGNRVTTTARAMTSDLVELSQTHGRQLRFFPCDLSDQAQVDGLIENAELLTEVYDGFVSNAGVGTEGLLTLLPPRTIRHCMDVNLFAPILITQAILKGMLNHQKGGSLVLVASICAHHGQGGLSAYAAAKAGLCGFSKGVARDYGPRGIRSNVVLPGFLETDMTRSLDSNQRAKITQRTALKRTAQTSEIAQVIMHLLSPDASFTTGSEYVVDGGLTG